MSVITGSDGCVQENRKCLCFNLVYIGVYVYIYIYNESKITFFLCILCKFCTYSGDGKYDIIEGGGGGESCIVRGCFGWCDKTYWRIFLNRGCDMQVV